MGVSSIDDGGEVVGEGSWGCLGAGTHLASMDQTARKPGACDAEPPADAAAMATARRYFQVRTVVVPKVCVIDDK